ncbi:MFS transporter [Cytobacillus purgationiresistens]|uniref:MFS family permease n=1 Tax=Cytobacillus purgationiresistens TaxID=863449 RepID=A0ABU0AHS5_9BACI|nr:MFS transporter [Cytobacillus purgationiresistens]MDQ0270352.1 MFS family permease [Cytobacillus purgationiresistens]
MRWVILGFLFFLYIINYADKAIAGYAAVEITNDFSLTPTQWGLVGSSFFWSFALANIFGSGLADRFGTKRMLSIMALSWTILQFGVYFITSLEMLIVYRILLGIFEGPFFATAITHLNRWFKPESRGLSTSILNFGATVGGLISAPVLVYLIVNHGWRFSFASLGFLSLVWAILWLIFGKDAPKDGSYVEVKVQKEKPKFKWADMSKVLLSIHFLIPLFASFAVYWYISWNQVWMPSFLVQSVGVSPTQMGYFAALIGLTAGLFTIGLAMFSDYLFKKNGSYKISRVVVLGFH